MQVRTSNLSRQQSQADFITTVFSTLDEYEVRYCVLHSWETLPERIESDLDIGVHPKDRTKLALALADMAAKGYKLVQSLNYFVNAHYTVFTWFHSDGSPRFAALDIIFEHRRGGLIVPSGEELVANRSREENFWIPDPSAEFAYLLSKKTWKRSISPKQIERWAKRYELNLFTGRTRREFTYSFAKWAGTKHFRMVVTMDDVKKIKPNPEGLYKILGKRDPATALYLGDNIDDALAARDVGVPFMAIIAPGEHGYRARAARFCELGAVALLPRATDLRRWLASS